MTAPSRSSRPNRFGSRVVALGLALPLGISLGPSALAAQEEDETSKSFSIPLRREARDEALVAMEHIGAQRWAKAIDVLQGLVEEQDAAVLPESYRASAREPSEHPAHPGAGEWARRELFALPAAAQTLYRDRYGALAMRALEDAEKSRSTARLLRVATRWPLCRAAGRAWTILGDLEAERGHPRAALLAWRRAVSESSPLGDAERAALDTRIAWATAEIESEQESATAHLSDPSAREPKREPWISPPDTAMRGPIPSRDAAPWRIELDLTPFSPATSRSRAIFHPLFPVLSGDRVLVNSSLQLYCVDAYTGGLVWSSGVHEGWLRLKATDRSKLFDGLNYNQLLIAPAVGGRVAVAALQLPYSLLPSEMYQGIDVMSTIPQRRLFAFDVETGALLWDHAPELVWSDSKDRFDPAPPKRYGEKMLVAGPPTVTGSRVLVPCYVLEGRIPFHVACYELATGDLLWTTPVVSGQRSRNMFGRAMEEFCSTPVVVHGDRVIVQSELGTIAALDLLTGRILWESLYRQVPIPQNSGYSHSSRRLTWRLAPPVVTNGLVVSTPSDSDEIAAFDLEDGRVLWTYPNDMLVALDNEEPRRTPFNLFLGADDDTIYLGGGRVAALRKPGGLATPSLFHLVWQYPTDSLASERTPRPLLCREAVLVPLNDRRVVLDRRDGTSRRSLGVEWGFEQYGNPLVANGLLFTLGGTGLNGFFDWDVLLDRQKRRLQASPADVDVAIDTAALYARRAEAALDDGELFASLSYLQTASDLLVPIASDERATASARAQSELHRTLRLEARALEAQGHRAGALAALAKAKPLARTDLELRDTLLQLEHNLRDSNKREEHLATLKELEERCGHLPIPPSLEGSTSVPLALEGIPATRAPTIALWVLLARADQSARTGAVQAALTDWHTVLANHSNAELAPSLSARSVATKRIAEQLDTPRGREAYAAFEERARELLERSREARDVDGLLAVSRRFPHSLAATEALDARLDWAYDESDAGAIAAIAYGDDGGGPRGEEAIEKALYRLGRVLSRRGSDAFERGFLASVLRRDPRATSDLDEHGRRPVRDVLAELEADAPDTGPRVPRFAQPLVGGTLQIGSYTYVGGLSAPPEAETPPLEQHVYLVRSPDTSRRPQFARSMMIDRIEAFSTTSGDTPAWRAFLDDPVRDEYSCAVSADRVLLGGEESLQALDTAGDLVWRRSTGLPVISVDEAEGVCVVVVGSSLAEAALAFDAHSGVPLWGIELAEPGGWRAPLVGDGKVVFLSSLFNKRTTLRIVDLFRGTAIPDAELRGPSERAVETYTWIADGKAFLPDFRSVDDGPSVTAIDLETGKRLWDRPMPPNEDFRYIARHDGATYFVTVAITPEANGGVYEFDTEYGTLRRIVPLRPGELPIGLAPRQVTELPTDELFTHLEIPTTGQMVVRSMHLPYQPKWSRTIDGLRDVTAIDAMPLPALSDELIAIALMVKVNQSRTSREAQLILMDRESGSYDKTQLDAEFGSVDRLELRGLGESLFVIGNGTSMRSWVMQVLEKLR